MHEFLSQDIQFVYTSLVTNPFYCYYRTEMKYTKASIRLVCKSLHSIVDELSGENQSPLWAWKYNIHDPQNEAHARLDTHIDCLDDILDIEQQYPHELRILCIRVEDENGAGLDPMLTSVIASPWTLRVLHISFPGATRRYDSEEFPISILSGLLSLRILSIAAPNPLCISGKLFMPQISTLFLTCTPDPRSNISEWSFPNLENLSIDTRGWPLGGLYDLGGDDWPRSNRDGVSLSFGRLLRRHGGTIKSLRMIPLIQTALCPHPQWTSLPQLETLATDLVRYSPIATEYPPLMHIIHISTHPYTKHQLTKVLLEAVRSVPSLRTLTITEDPFMPNEVAQADEEDQSLGLLKLEELCRIREIRIVGKVGSDVCCISKAYRSLKAPYVF